MKNLIEKIMAEKIWDIMGSFGYVDEIPESENNKFNIKTKQYKIESEYKKDNLGVYHYFGEFTNISGKELSLNALSSIFNIGGGEYEVYTQHNTWQNENTGLWQPLNTSVVASTDSIRTCYPVSPVLAIWNKQTNRGIVFHLIADYAWTMEAKIMPSGSEPTYAQVKIGVNSKNFLYKLENGESVKTPEIIFYEFENKTDLDCFKLHNYCIQNHKRKQMPVVYNSWLCRFDQLTYENILNQIEPAAKLGAEYFTVDAGWFGDGENWGINRGDWKENMTAGFRGRLKEFADTVRANGMKFGLWFEIESAYKDADILKERPELFFKENAFNDVMPFLDFSKKEARDYIMEVLSTHIEKYGIEYIKFDFNQDIFYDRTQSAYMKYYQGYRQFVKEFKAKYPNIYLENCASGGLRMDLKNAFEFDSFWLSDNQSPYEGMRIFKEGIKRLPPQCIEKWAVLTMINEFKPVYGGGVTEKIISTNDATWDITVGVDSSFLKGFLTGSPIGFSCDLNALSANFLNDMAEFIQNFKNEREFWENAVCHILADTDKMLVMEYRDINSDKIKILAFAYKHMQTKLFVYPKLDTNATYLVGDEKLSGYDISENGIELPINGNYRTSFINLEKIN